MAKTEQSKESFKLYALLRFVQLTGVSNVKIGPIQFWRASEIKEYLKDELHANFLKYLTVLGRFYVRDSQNGSPILVKELLPKEMTICCIDTEFMRMVPDEKWDECLEDALYSLFFVSMYD